MIHLIVTKQAKWSKEKSKSKQFNLTLNQKCQIFMETVRTMEKAGDDTEYYKTAPTECRDVGMQKTGNDDRNKNGNIQTQQITNCIW